MSKRKLSILLVTLLLLSLLPGCAPTTEKINWTLHGTWVNQDGTLGESASFTFSGELPLSFDGTKAESVELDIPFPKIYGFDSYNSSIYAIWDFSYENDKVQEILYCTGGVYNPKTNCACPMSFCILDRECLVFSFYDAPGEYLVATVDPNADALEWLDIYKELFPS